MNSFFASVEQLDCPDYRGKPVAVVPVMADNTSFIAASPEAKRLGVRMGIPVWQARQQFPQLIILKARPAEYIAIHKKLLKACDQHIPVTKVYSIDEWSVRLAPAEKSADVASEIAKRVKRQIEIDVEGPLPCSAGIAPTRLLAKIACDLQKPNGLTVLNVADLPRRIEHLELDDLPGISHSMVARLNRHGVQSVRDLWHISRVRAHEIWGSVGGTDWWDGFHGIEVPEAKKRKSSMGHSNVLAQEFRNEEAAHGIMVRLACKLAMRLRHHGYFANYLSAWVRHECGRTWVDGIALPCLQDTPSILQQFEKLWQKRAAMLADLRRHVYVGPPKKVSVDVLGLDRAVNVPDVLFDELNRPLRLSKVMDFVNSHLGTHKLHFGSMHDYRHEMDDKIAFGRVPDEIIGI